MPFIKATERFFEANFYSQVARDWYPNRLVWFTPSTNQEADLAFDSLAQLGGWIFFFQFKLPKARRTRSTICGPGHPYVQTLAAHEQLRTFREHAEHWEPGHFFYVMPALITLDEFAAENWNVLPHTYYWDVRTGVPLNLPAPTKTDGSPRKSEQHYLNLEPNCCSFRLRSDPIDIEATPFNLLREQFGSAPHFQPQQQGPSLVTLDEVAALPLVNPVTFRQFVRTLPSGTRGLAIIQQ